MIADLRELLETGRLCSGRRELRRLGWMSSVSTALRRVGMEGGPDGRSAVAVGQLIVTVVRTESVASIVAMCDCIATLLSMLLLVLWIVMLLLLRIVVDGPYSAV